MQAWRLTVRFTVVKSPSCLPHAHVRSSSAFCASRKAKAALATASNLGTAVSSTKRLPWPAAPSAVTRSHQILRSPATKAAAHNAIGRRSTHSSSSVLHTSTCFRIYRSCCKSM